MYRIGFQHYMVKPLLKYAMTVWDPYQHNEVAELEKIQHNGIRFVEGRCKSTNTPNRNVDLQEMSQPS